MWLISVPTLKAVCAINTWKENKMSATIEFIQLNTKKKKEKKNLRLLELGYCTNQNDNDGLITIISSP